MHTSTLHVLCGGQQLNGRPHVWHAGGPRYLQLVPQVKNDVKTQGDSRELLPMSGDEDGTIV